MMGDMAEFSEAKAFEVMGMLDEDEELRNENARYKAALQEIERVAFRVTEGPDPDGDLVTYCQWCRMADRGRVQHRDWCAVTIAHRALHPEEGTE